VDRGGLDSARQVVAARKSRDLRLIALRVIEVAAVTHFDWTVAIMAVLDIRRPLHRID